MSRVFLYKPEVITPSGNSLEDNIKNFSSDRTFIGHNSLYKDELLGQICGWANWQDEDFEKNQFKMKNKMVLTKILKDVLKDSKIKKFDQVICLLAPRLEDLDIHIRAHGNIENFIAEFEYEEFLVNELSKYQCPIDKSQIQILDNTCTSGNSLLGYGFQGIKLNEWKSVLLIAVDIVDPFNIFILKSLGALATSDLDPDLISRPFDKLRSGFVKSDGAACAILTGDMEFSEESVGEILSFSQTSDAFKLTDGRDDSQSIIKAMQLAIERAQLKPSSIDLIKAHGTSTVLNDLHEAKAIEQVFGKSDKSPYVTSLKGHIGHVTDSSGLVESIILCSAIKKGYIPGILNLKDPDFDLKFAKQNLNLEKKHSINILSNTLGFGGNNCCVVLRA